MGRPAVAIKEINKRIPANSLLTAKEYLDGRYISPGGHKMRMVLCDCQCGGQINAVVADLMRGYPVSCGCVKRGPKLGSKFNIKKVKKLNKTRKGAKKKKITSAKSAMMFVDEKAQWIAPTKKDLKNSPAAGTPVTVTIKKENHSRMSDYMKQRQDKKLK